MTCKIWHVFYISVFLMCPVRAPPALHPYLPAELFVHNSPQSQQSQYFIDASSNLTGFVLRLFFFCITLLVVGRRASLTDPTLLAFRDARRFFLAQGLFNRSVRKYCRFPALSFQSIWQCSWMGPYRLGRKFHG